MSLLQVKVISKQVGVALEMSAMELSLVERQSHWLGFRAPMVAAMVVCMAPG